MTNALVSLAFASFYMYNNRIANQNTWTIYIYIWRIIVNELTITTTLMPILHGCDLCVAAESFFHADRVADFHVLILVTEGVIHVTEEGTPATAYHVGPGDLLFLKAGVRHYGTIEIPKGTRWSFVHFSLETPKEALPTFLPDPTPMTQYQPVRYALTLPKYLHDMSDTPVAEQLLALVEYFHSDAPTKRWDINLRLHGLLTSIALYGKEKTPTSLSGRICEYLSAHYNEPFSAKELEREFYLSYKYMAAVFKKEMHTTMQHFHTEMRMNAACKLLRSTLLPVGEISASLGYADMLYFSRCFHRFAGCSPTEYRRKAVHRY